MPTSFEDQYLDVLQNIEMALASVYRENDDMTDANALSAMNALVKTYQAEAAGRTAPTLRLNPLAQDAFERVQTMCEWRLGREQFEHRGGKRVEIDMEPKTIQEIIACLRRVQRSIEKWQKRGGRRGYFELVDQFLP